MSNTLSAFNRQQFSDWEFDLREGRLGKVASLIQQESPGRMLDLGCSDGLFSSRFLANGWDIVGTEIAPRRAHGAATHNLQTALADMSSPFPFTSGWFNLVLAGELIEHLVDTDLFLMECNRVLGIGGKLILTTPNLVSLENRARILFGRYPIWVDYHLAPDLSGHVRAYTPRELKKQLRQHGFQVEVQTGNFVPVVPQQWRDDIQWPWLQKLGDWFPNLAMDIIIKAEKTEDGE